jgi:hypothetical protein
VAADVAAHLSCPLCTGTAVQRLHMRTDEAAAAVKLPMFVLVAVCTLLLPGALSGRIATAAGSAEARRQGRVPPATSGGG